MSHYHRMGPPPRWTGIPSILIALAFMGYGVVNMGPAMLAQGYWWFLVLWCLIPIFVIYGGIVTLLGKNKGWQQKKDGTVYRKAPGFDLLSVIMGGAFLAIGVYWIIGSLRAGSNGWIGGLLWMILPFVFFKQGLKNLLHRK